MSSVAFGAPALSGTYRTTITSTALHGEVKGAWTITFNRGAFSADKGRTVATYGNYAIAGSKVTFRRARSGPLPITSVYRFSLHGATLKFSLISGSGTSATCEARQIVLAGTFQRTGDRDAGHHHLRSRALSVPPVWSSASSVAMSSSDNAKSKICAFSSMRSRWVDFGRTIVFALEAPAQQHLRRRPADALGDSATVASDRCRPVPSGLYASSATLALRACLEQRPAVLERAELDLVDDRRGSSRPRSPRRARRR